MDTDVAETDLVAKLKRLDANAGPSSVDFGYETLLDRHAAKHTRARRRLAIARGTAGALVVALVCASVWRFDQPQDARQVAVNAAVNEEAEPAAQPRIVRADNWLAVAALEDQIVTLDEALNVARQGGGTAEVARLEKTRAELFASYNQVRYAQLVSANF
jgi:hypothetical protein